MVQPVSPRRSSVDSDKITAVPNYLHSIEQVLTFSAAPSCF